MQVRAPDGIDARPGSGEVRDERAIHFCWEQQSDRPSRTGPRLPKFRGSRSAADFVWTSGSVRALAPSVQALTLAFSELRDATSKRDQFRFHLIRGMLPGRPNGRERIPLERSQSRSGSCSLCCTCPRGSRKRAPGLERSLGSGLQIAQDGEHPSVVSV